MLARVTFRRSSERRDRRRHLLGRRPGRALAIPAALHLAQGEDGRRDDHQRERQAADDRQGGVPAVLRLHCGALRQESLFFGVHRDHDRADLVHHPLAFTAEHDARGFAGTTTRARRDGRAQLG